MPGSKIGEKCYIANELLRRGTGFESVYFVTIFLLQYLDFTHFLE